MGLRVAVVTTHFPPSRGFGGVCESSWGLASGLVEAGAEVDVVASDASLEGRISTTRFQELECPGLRVHTFQHFLSGKQGFSFSSRPLIERVAESCDITHVNGIITHPVHLAAVSCRSQKRPYVISLRNGLDAWLLRYRHLRKLIAFHAYVRRDIEFASVVHLTSELELRGAKAFRVQGPFSVIPNGFDPRAIPEPLEPGLVDDAWPILRGRRILLFLSRLSPQKGLDMLLKHWDVISAPHPDVMLVIAGPDYGGHERLVREWVRQTKNAGKVVFTGAVEGALKWSLFARASLFVLPSYTENFGNVVTEALAAGTPVVTTHATPWPAVSRKGLGAWVPATPEAIRDAILELLKQPEDSLKAMGALGRKHVTQELTWKNIGQRMKRLYEAILQRDEIPFQPSA